MHKIYCLGYDGITCELHPTAQVYVGAGSVGQLFSDYLAENGRRIFILGQIPINGSVKFLGIFNFHRTSGPFLLRISELPMIPQAGYTVVTPIRTGPLSQGTLPQRLRRVAWCRPWPSCLHSQESGERARCCTPCP